MDEVRTRRNFPAETWAVVRDAYLGGETAESISRRLKMSVNTIRKRAGRCGWTHAAHAAALARTEAETGAGQTSEPAEALERATRHAARLLTEGRASEAQELVRAAEGLKRLTQGTSASGERVSTPQEIEAKQAEEAAVRARVADRLMRMVEHMAHQMLMERPMGVPVLYAPFVYAFRARHFGPEVEAADQAHALAQGWSQHIWDEEGRLKAGITAKASGRAPPSTEPPSDAATSYPCCAWMETAEADIRAGREPDYGQAREAD